MLLVDFANMYFFEETSKINFTENTAEALVLVAESDATFMLVSAEAAIMLAKYYYSNTTSILLFTLIFVTTLISQHQIIIAYLLGPLF